MDDLFQNLNDSIEVDPQELESALTAVLVATTAKRAVDARRLPWSDKQELVMQESISALVAAATARGLETIRVIVTRQNGQKVARDLDVNLINKTRSLQ